MTPWGQIKFGYEVLGESIEDLSVEYGVSVAELQYAAETWTPVETEDLKQAVKGARDILEPQYAKLEQIFVDKVRHALLALDSDSDSTPDRIKKLTECYKTLRFSDKDQDKGCDVAVTIINSFGGDGGEPRNVTKATVSIPAQTSSDHVAGQE